jgi:ABC-type multidrug transport system fused ATPase/permease subunit
VVGLLERFYIPDKGQVLIDDVPVEDYHIATLRSQISLVSQEPILFSGTVTENIRYGKQDATQEEIEAAAKASNAHDFIMQFPGIGNIQDDTNSLLYRTI